jgi:hypothetical protein
LDEVVRLVSYATPQPIIGITTSRKHPNPAKIQVFTEYASHDAPDYCTGFDLEKTGGKWRITFQGSSSTTIAELVLSGGT